VGGVGNSADCRSSGSHSAASLPLNLHSLQALPLLTSDFTQVDAPCSHIRPLTSAACLAWTYERSCGPLAGLCDCSQLSTGFAARLTPRMTGERKDTHKLTVLCSLRCYSSSTHTARAPHSPY
jgi:hypothetical protein